MEGACRAVAYIGIEDETPLSLQCFLLVHLPLKHGLERFLREWENSRARKNAPSGEAFYPRERVQKVLFSCGIFFIN